MISPSHNYATHSKQREVEGEVLQCKVCCQSKHLSKTSFMQHLASVHCSSEGGSYTCHYGDNGICNACPAVGISHADYVGHVNRHHIQVRPPSSSSGQEARLSFSHHNNSWTVYSATVNLPAVLNDPKKGKQKDFFTRNWGVDFVDSALLPSSPHICELPPHSFDRYLHKVRKYYSRHKKPGAGTGGVSCSASPSSSREATPSPCPPQSSSPHSANGTTPPRPSPQQLDAPAIFLDQNFDLSNPNTFNQVFPFLADSLSTTTRSNPFHLDSREAIQVEKSGKLVQEKLSHYLDQVEVSIAAQVATKSHHFFQVMTYHDALMSQLIDLISVVKTLRQRLADVEQGVVLALKVPQLCMRKENLGSVVQALTTISTLHQAQPTIEILLARQEFAGALDLIATSQDIIKDDIGDVASVRHLPAQLTDLTEVIGKMLMGDFQTTVGRELERELQQCKASELGEGVSDCQVDECALSSIVMGLIRQRSFTFLEYFEECAVGAVKNVIKDVVLSILDLTEDTTLTNLVADFALIATPEGWTDLLDILVGSLIIWLRRLEAIYQIILQSLSQAQLQPEAACSSSEGEENLPERKLRSSAKEVMINICDQIHERLGKLVTVRSRPNPIKLVRPKELASVQALIQTLSQVTVGVCGKQSPGLQLSHQGQTILYIQHFHESARSRIATMLENEKWRKYSLEQNSLADIHSIIGEAVCLVSSHCDNPGDLDLVRVRDVEHPFTFVESIIIFLWTLSDYCSLLDQLPLACVEIGLKTADLLKLFNSRTCQLVLGAGAVSLAGLKTITIRNLAVTLRSLSLVSHLIPLLRSNLERFPQLTDKQSITIGRNFDHATKDYAEHLGELERKIVLIVDAALQQQLSTWQRKPPVPSNSFKAIGKQLLKLLEAIQDILPPPQVSSLFRSIHTQFLRRVGERLREARLRPDNSPGHGLVVSELIFYRENLKYMSVLTPEDLSDSTLQTVWSHTDT